MLAQSAPALQAVPAPARRCGAGLDTSRQGHSAAFPRDDEDTRQGSTNSYRAC